MELSQISVESFDFGLGSDLNDEFAQVLLALLAQVLCELS